jgi:hypothetical protein
MSRTPWCSSSSCLNTGGCLTRWATAPVPGYLRGVPFLWTLRLLPQWLLVNGLLLLVYLVWDRRGTRGRPPAPSRETGRCGGPSG